MSSIAWTSTDIANSFSSGNMVNLALSLTEVLLLFFTLKTWKTAYKNFKYYSLTNLTPPVPPQIQNLRPSHHIHINTPDEPLNYPCVPDESRLMVTYEGAGCTQGYTPDCDHTNKRCPAAGIKYNYHGFDYECKTCMKAKVGSKLHDVYCPDTNEDCSIPWSWDIKSGNNGECEKITTEDFDESSNFVDAIM